MRPPSAKIVGLKRKVAGPHLGGQNDAYFEQQLSALNAIIPAVAHLGLLTKTMGTRRVLEHLEPATASRGARILVAPRGARILVAPRLAHIWVVKNDA